MKDLKTIYYLMLRLLIIKFRDKFDLVNIFFVPLIIGISTAFVLKYTAAEGEYSLLNNEKFIQFLFLSIIIIIFISLTNSVREIVANKIYIIKELRSGISLYNYFIATFLVLAIIAVIQVLLYIVASSYIVELKDSFGVFFTWLYLASIAATSFGLFVSAIVKTEISATMAIPLILIPQIILGGGMIKFDEINKDLFVRNVSIKDKNRAIPLIAQVMISKWATEGLYIEMATHFLQKRTVIGSACKKDFTNLKEKATKEYFEYVKTDVTDESKKEKFEATMKIVKKAEVALNICTAPVNLYMNSELATLILGAKSDFEQAVAEDKIDILHETLSANSFATIDEIDGSKIINTFASTTKYYNGIYYNATFLNKLVIVLYSMFFLILSYLFLRRT